MGGRCGTCRQSVKVEKQITGEHSRACKLIDTPTTIGHLTYCNASSRNNHDTQRMVIGMRNNASYAIFPEYLQLHASQSCNHACITNSQYMESMRTQDHPYSLVLRKTHTALDGSPHCCYCCYCCEAPAAGCPQLPPHSAPRSPIPCALAVQVNLTTSAPLDLDPDLQAGPLPPKFCMQMSREPWFLSMNDGIYIVYIIIGRGTHHPCKICIPCAKRQAHSVGRSHGCRWRWQPRTLNP